jgi:hypothetical protein
MALNETPKNPPIPGECQHGEPLTPTIPRVNSSGAAIIAGSVLEAVQ